MNNSKCDLENMRIGGEIHKRTKDYIKEIIKPNMLLYDLSEKIENNIKEECKKLNINNNINNGIAFPTGLSINNCAAH